MHPFSDPGNDQLLLEHAPGQRDPSSSSDRRTRLLAGKLSGEPGAHGLDRPLDPFFLQAGHADKGEVVGTHHGVGVHTTTMDRPDRSGWRVLGDGLPYCWDGDRAFLGVRHRRDRSLSLTLGTNSQTPGFKGLL